MDDALNDACGRVFEYPYGPPPRRHGPKGYSDYQSYKPWLRDEFVFRCAYCLWRECWEGDGHHGFGVEHVRPQSTAPGADLVYDGLVYACNTCNSTRRDVSLPMDLRVEAPGRHVRVLADGMVQGRTPAGDDLIALCRLNRPLLIAARRRILVLIAVLRSSADPLAVQSLRELLAFPLDLPNLAALRPPGGNMRPEGIADSYFERRRRGEQLEAY